MGPVLKLSRSDHEDGIAFIRRSGPVTTGQYRKHFGLQNMDALFQLKAMEFCGLIRCEVCRVPNGHGYAWRAI